MKEASNDFNAHEHRRISTTFKDALAPTNFYYFQRCQDNTHANKKE